LNKQAQEIYDKSEDHDSKTIIMSPPQLPDPVIPSPSPDMEIREALANLQTQMNEMKLLLQLAVGVVRT
jgi:hypothetical protein